jgi:hypothetical protein
LNINIEKTDIRGQMIGIIDMLYLQFETIIKNRIAIDDNKDFLRISTENRAQFTEVGKTNIYKTMEDEDIIKKITGEDIIRFK